MADHTPATTVDSLTPSRLKGIGLFGGISEATLGKLCQALPVSRIEPGKRVVDEGESARSMFIVLEGELEVVKRSQNGTNVRVAVLGGGDWFGEMSLLDVQPRSASVLCVAPALLVTMTNHDVDQLLYRCDMKSYTLLIMNIARELSRRLRVADKVLAQVAVTLATEYSQGSGAR